MILVNKNYWHLKTHRIYRVIKRLPDCDNHAGEHTYRIVYINREGKEFDRGETEFSQKFQLIPVWDEFQTGLLFMAIKVVEGNPSTVTGMKCDATFEQGKEVVKGVASRDMEGNVVVTIDEQFDMHGDCKITLHDGQDSMYIGHLKSGIWSA